MAADTDVLVVGGGLAGLALGGYLARQGAPPTIVEQAPDWRESGYGIGLWEGGLDVLADLDCLDAARDRAADPEAFAVRGEGGRLLARASLPADGTLLLVVHRADLHAALRGAVPDGCIRMGTEPTRIEQRRDDVRVAFDDGSTETFDLVIGADGVHSTVRERCFDDWTRREYDTYVWSLWPRQDVDVGADMVSVWGPGSEGFVARVGDRVGFNLAARRESPPEPPARDALRDAATAVGWRLPDLLETDDEPFFDRVRDVSCERWHRDRVALVGDAAHAVHPISGMGASLALQDARVLAQELATAGDVETALGRYEQRRRPEVRRAKRSARVEAAVTFVESPRLRGVRDWVVEHTPLFELFIESEAGDAVGVF